MSRGLGDVYKRQDIEAAKNCYNSEEYVEARKHLKNNATREHIIFEGM